MSYAPKTIAALASYWVQQGGVNLGIVGDLAHQARATYHNGKDVIDRYGRTALDDYSIRTARDRAGLTDAASALDLGKLDGTLANLRKFSVWFVGQCRANAAGTSDVREFIYSPDGKTVLRWDRERGYASAPRTGEADSSHLYHSHISFYRDSEPRSKTGLFAGYFAVPPDTSTGEPMGLSVKLAATATTATPWTSFAVAKVKGAGHSAIRVSDRQYLPVADGLDLGCVQYGALTAPLDNLPGDRTNVVVTNINGEQYVLLRSDVALAALVYPDKTPFGQADIDAAYAKGKAEGDKQHTVGIAVDGVEQVGTRVTV